MCLDIFASRVASYAFDEDGCGATTGHCVSVASAWLCRHPIEE